MTALKPRATGSRTQEHPSAFRARISAHRSSAANASRSTAAAAISPIPTQFSLSRSQKRSEEHTSELQSLMRISYAVFCLKKKTTTHNRTTPSTHTYLQHKHHHILWTKNR